MYFVFYIKVIHKYKMLYKILYTRHPVSTYQTFEDPN